MCKQMEQVANTAVLETNIRYVQKGRVSVFCGAEKGE